MQYRTLGNTGLKVSEIGFGGEWMDGTLEETIAVTRACEDAGINILDCWTVSYTHLTLPTSDLV